LVTGSPFYPKGLSEADDPLSEVHPDFYTSSFIGNRHHELLPLVLRAVEKIAGPCHLMALIGSPLLVGWLVISGARCYRRPGGNVDGAARWALVLLLVLSCLVLAVTPFSVENRPGTLNSLRGGYLPVRFGMCFLVVTVVALAVALHDFSQLLTARAIRGQAGLSSPRARGGSLLACLGLAVPPLFLGGGLLQLASVLFRESHNTTLAESTLQAVILWLVGLDICLLGGLSPRIRRAVVATVGATMLAGAAWAAGWLAARWHGGFAHAYDLLLTTKACSSLAVRQPVDTRLCVLDYRHYPFFGSDRRFRVCQPFRVPSYRWLVEYLRARQVTIVVVLNRDTLTYGRFHNVSAWIDAHPDVFEPVQEGDRITVFRVRLE
jgi:hypothetical protein